MAGPRL